MLVAFSGVSLFCFPPYPLPFPAGIAFLVTNCAHAFVGNNKRRGILLPPSLVVCVFARWHQELGHDSSKLVSLLAEIECGQRPGTVRVARQVVCVRARASKGHGEFTCHRSGG